MGLKARGQSLHHFLKDAEWKIEDLRETRLLKPAQIYQTKPQLAVAIIEELKTWGFRLELVLADSLYGESGDVIEAIGKQKLKYMCLNQKW